MTYIHRDPSNEPWGDERVALLRLLATKNLSASEIMDKLNRESPGRPITRNAALGKACRLGIALFNGVGPRPVPKVKPAKTRAYVRARPDVSWLVTDRPVVVDKAALPATDSAIPRGQRKSLLELGPDDCRWPCGDVRTPEFFFCGGDASGPSPYCRHHSRIAFQSVSERKRERAAEAAATFGVVEPRF